MYVAILSLIARDYGDAGDPLRAFEVTSEIVALHRKFGRTDSLPGFMMRASLAFRLSPLGHVRESAEAYAKLVEESGAAGAESVPPAYAFLHAPTLSRLGEYERARAMATTGLEALAASGNLANASRARYVLARVLLDSGDEKAAAEAIEEAAKGFAALGAVPLHQQLLIDRTRIDLALARGDIAAADALLKVAIDRVASRRGGDDPRIGLMLVQRARAELAGGNPAAAIESATEAVRILSLHTLDPGKSADVGEAWLWRGEAETQLGLDASASLTAAAEALAQGLGVEHPLTIKARSIHP